jgi:pimeloyl-ACP methyl ester carboxylesterase
MRQFVLLFIALVSSAAAQDGVYVNPLPADPPYYRVRYEGSAQPGELVYPASFTIWIPSGVETLRGVVVHQHGCGEGSCKSGQTGAFDLHWQALAGKHGCALLSPVYEQPEKADCQMWCDPRKGSDAAFQKALTDLSKLCGHPELASVPWALWGHSGGGHWCGGMTLVHPDRVAAAWLRSGVPPTAAAEGKPAPYTVSGAACQVPIMCNLGTQEGVTDKAGRFAGVWPGNEAFFLKVRGQGGLIGVSIDPLSSHDCGNQRYLAIPWLDACLTARLPKKNGDPLTPMPTDSACLVPLEPGAKEVVAPVPASKFTGDVAKSIWLPGEQIAVAWTQYTTDSKVTDATPPPAPTNLKVTANVLTWTAEADLESGLASFVIERDGQFLANVPEQDKNPFGRPIFQNLSYSDTPTQPLVEMRFTDTKAEPGKTHQYRVIAVNTAGLKSS